MRTLPNCPVNVNECKRVIIYAKDSWQPHTQKDIEAFFIMPQKFKKLYTIIFLLLHFITRVAILMFGCAICRFLGGCRHCCVIHCCILHQCLLHFFMLLLSWRWSHLFNHDHPLALLFWHRWMVFVAEFGVHSYKNHQENCGQHAEKCERCITETLSTD